MAEEAVVRFIMQDETAPRAPNARGRLDQPAYQPQSFQPSQQERRPIPVRVESFVPRERPAVPIPKKKEEFDPFVEARKQRDRETQQQQIKLAYQDLYGIAQEGTSTFQHFLDAIVKARQVLPGTITNLVSTVATVAVAMTGMRAEIAEARTVPVARPFVREAEAIPIARSAGSPRDMGIPVARAAPPTAKPSARAEEAPFSRLAAGIERPGSLLGRRVSEPSGPIERPGSLLGRPAPQSGPVLKAPPAMVTLAPQKALPAHEPRVAAPTPTEATTGALSQMGAALPIAGAVIGGLVAIKHGLTEAVGAVGDFVVGMTSAQADPAAAVEGIGQGLKKTSDALFIVNPLLSILGSVTGEVVGALGRMMHQLDQFADRYGEYSPQLAMASALVDVSQTLGDLRRAQEIGPDLARYVTAENQLRQRWEDTKIQFLKAILPAVTVAAGGLEKVTAVVEQMLTIWNTLPTEVKAAFSPLAAIIDLLSQLVGQKDQELPDPLGVIVDERVGRESDLANQ